MSNRRIMKMEKDILEKVGKPSYRVPEGYFEDLGERLRRIPSEQTSQEAGPWMRFKPYLALAACFAIALAIGTAILKKTASGPSPDQLFNETVFADMVSVPQPDLYLQALYDEENPLSDEDIIEYLIESGVSAEQIEFARQEK